MSPAVHSSIDLDSTGRIPKSTVLTSLSSGQSPAGRYTYDQVRETLKHVSLDASGNVELDDFVDLVSKLKEGAGASAGQVLRGGALSGLVGGVGVAAKSQAASGGASQATGGGKVLVQGSNTNITHSINEDERTEFTRHINQVCKQQLDTQQAAPADITSSDRTSLATQTLARDCPFLPTRSKSLTSAEVSAGEI